jgi:hypothetical protein
MFGEVISAEFEKLLARFVSEFLHVVPYEIGQRFTQDEVSGATREHADKRSRNRGRDRGNGGTKQYFGNRIRARRAQRKAPSAWLLTRRKLRRGDYIAELAYGSACCTRNQ